MKTININNEIFTICKPVDVDTAYNFYYCKGYSIYDAYKKPSASKVAIWEYWKDFFRKFEQADMVVYSATCLFFTIKVTFYYNGKSYMAMIYPTHNDLHEVVEI